MKQVFFYVLFWILSMSLNATDKVEATIQQTWEPHASEPVTENIPVRLKDIDVTNPLFIFK